MAVRKDSTGVAPLGTEPGMGSMQEGTVTPANIPDPGPPQMPTEAEMMANTNAGKATMKSKADQGKGSGMGPVAKDFRG